MYIVTTRSDLADRLARKGLLATALPIISRQPANSGDHLPAILTQLRIAGQGWIPYGWS